MGVKGEYVMCKASTCMHVCVSLVVILVMAEINYTTFLTLFLEQAAQCATEQHLPLCLSLSS